MLLAKKKRTTQKAPLILDKPMKNSELCLGHIMLECKGEAENPRSVLLLYLQGFHQHGSGNHHSRDTFPECMWATFQTYAYTNCCFCLFDVCVCLFKCCCVFCLFLWCLLTELLSRLNFDVFIEWLYYTFSLRRGIAIWHDPLIQSTHSGFLKMYLAFVN